MISWVKMFLLLIGGATVQFTIYSTQMPQISVKICLFDYCKLTDLQMLYIQMLSKYLVNWRNLEDSLKA